MCSLFLSRLLVGAALCGGLFAPSIARADAFSPIPTGDPIYRQLEAISSLGEAKPLKPATNLTRYEAALQVARAAALVGTKPDSLSRSGWRSLRDLTLSLKSELRQLGVGVEEILAQCARQLDAPSKPTLPAPASKSPKGRPGAVAAPAAPSFLNATPSPASLGMGRSSVQGDLDTPLLGRLGRIRMEAALLALQRDTRDPLFNGRSALGTGSGASQIAGRNASVSVELNSWLRVRGLASQRQLGSSLDQPPVLSSQLFSGATRAQGLGGGLEVSPLNWLRLSTEVERLSTDIGTRGTRVGGGIGLSAWQNRLTMSAHLSRLQPEDRAMLPSTATELNVGLGVSERLSLSLLYQGLFSSQSETSRLAGGLNFNF